MLGMRVFYKIKKVGLKKYGMRYKKIKKTLYLLYIFPFFFY